MSNARSFYKTLLLAGFFAVIASCSKDDNETPEADQKLTQTEVKTILEADDFSGSLDTIISEAYLYNGSSGKNANTECYVADYSDTGFTITFENCNVNGTDNVNGTLAVVYTSAEETSSFTATYSDFYFGDIKLSGTRSYTVGTNMNEGLISFTVVSDITVTLADESVITENGTKTFGLTIGASLETSTYSLEGNWTIEAGGHVYKVIVDTALQGNLSCKYITTGLMTVEKSGLIVSVDFGDGDCDDTATVKYPNGATEEISLKD